jgi:hypothetical protein
MVLILNKSMSGWRGLMPRPDRWRRRPTPSRSCSPPVYFRLLFALGKLGYTDDQIVEIHRQKG